MLACEPPSDAIRRASAWALSKKAGSFKPVRACSGVLVRTRRTVQISRLVESKLSMLGYGAVRRMNVYTPRRWRSSPLLSSHLSSLYGRSQMPSGCGGNTLGPPILKLSRPLAASATSRIISASSRKRGPRASSWFKGSRSSSCGVMPDDCRYAADVTMRRWMAFMLHGVRAAAVLRASTDGSMNSTASQSSSSGCVGRAPCEPKSSDVSTIPRPNNCSQKRFTATRAVSGSSWLTSHRARPSRLGSASSGSGGSIAGTFA